MGSVRALLILTSLLVGCGRMGFENASESLGGVDAAPTYEAWRETTGTSEYRVGASETGWDTAETDCEADGGHLIIIDAAEEHDAVHARVAADVWIGLSDRITEGTYVTVTGAAPAYDGWSGSPPNNTGEDCVMISGLDGRWEDKDCPSARAFVCERDGIVAVPGAF